MSFVKLETQQLDYFVFTLCVYYIHYEIKNIIKKKERLWCGRQDCSSHRCVEASEGSGAQTSANNCAVISGTYRFAHPGRLTHRLRLAPTTLLSRPDQLPDKYIKLVTRRPLTPAGDFHRDIPPLTMLTQ